MRYILLSVVIFLQSCSAKTDGNPKVQIVESIKLYKDSIQLSYKTLNGLPDNDVNGAIDHKVRLLIYNKKIDSLELELKKY